MRTAISLLWFPLAIGLVGAQAAVAAEPTNSLKEIHAKLQNDKKSIVTQYMTLSDAEAKAFWPVYDEIQTEQAALAKRMYELLSSYATEMNANTLTDEKAAKLLDDWIKLDQDEAKQRAAAADKVMKVLPGKKAARYLQIESEYRALRNYDLAATVPLAK
jgi:hypothetical protein